METGVWRGGCAGILAYISKKYGYKNALYFFDSFEGLPQPTHEDGADARIFADKKIDGKMEAINKLIAPESYIKKLLFEKLQIEADKVNIVKGWFQDTLPAVKNKIGPISILRLDGDWYESTKVALENLYDQVEAGGMILIDDYYFWDGCRRAVDEFIVDRKLKVKMKKQDLDGTYFIKE